MPRYITKPRMRLISLNLPEPYIKALDKLVDAGFYPSRAEAIRSSIKDQLTIELPVLYSKSQEKCDPIRELIYKTISNVGKTPAEIMQEKEKYKK